MPETHATEGTAGGPVILYDGDCGFCSRVVIFVADRDPDEVFRFAPLQSSLGVAARRRAGVPTNDLDTMLLLDRGAVHTKSTAALRIAGGLRWPWSLARIFLLIPRPIRDFAYDVIARNRHRILPAPESCMLPAQLAGRVVEDEP